MVGKENFPTSSRAVPVKLITEHLKGFNTIFYDFFVYSFCFASDLEYSPSSHGIIFALMPLSSVACCSRPMANASGVSRFCSAEKAGMMPSQHCGAGAKGREISFFQGDLAGRSAAILRGWFEVMKANYQDSEN